MVKKTEKTKMTKKYLKALENSSNDILTDNATFLREVWIIKTGDHAGRKTLAAIKKDLMGILQAKILASPDMYPANMHLYVSNIVNSLSSNRRSRTVRQETVFELLREERDYQEAMPQHADKEQQQDTPISSWILYMRMQLKEAEKKIYMFDFSTALEHIRKATAVGVACMEYNQTKSRKTKKVT